MPDRPAARRPRSGSPGDADRRGDDASGITLYGAVWCPDCRRAKKFLGEQRVAYRNVDIDSDADGVTAVERLQGGGRTIPTVVFPEGDHLVNPTNERLAERLGLDLSAERGFYDLAIVGGGPTGLAAALYAAREGIDAIVVERSGLGGQAALTERIDNYPGFPEGIGGGDLADRIIAQVRRYQGEMLSAVGVETLRRDGGDLTLGLGSGQEVTAHAVLIATGSSYRRLGVPGEDALIGAGVHFCATCDGPFYRGSEELAVIGGGNSAVEEGMFLTQFARRVRILQREPELTASALLRDRVRDDPRIVVQTGVEVTELRADGHRLGEIVARDAGGGREYRYTPAAAFVFIGLDPNTGFLRGVVELDRWGFVRTDAAMRTSTDGVFAAGDVRAGSTKQLGAATGDGIAALISIRRHLEDHAHLPALEVDA